MTHILPVESRVSVGMLYEGLEGLFSSEKPDHQLSVRRFATAFAHRRTVKGIAEQYRPLPSTFAYAIGDALAVYAAPYSDRDLVELDKNPAAPSFIAQLKQQCELAAINVFPFHIDIFSQMRHRRARQQEHLVDDLSTCFEGYAKRVNYWDD